MTNAILRKRARRRGPPKSASEMAPDTTVGDILRTLLSVDADLMTVDDLSVFLLDRHATSAAVLDRGGAFLGFVSMTDLVRDRVLDGPTSNGSRRHDRSNGLDAEVRRKRSVREIMMPFTLTIDVRASIAQAAAVMAARGVHRLVAEYRGRLMGLVEARDVLRSLARDEGVFVPNDAEDDGASHARSARTAKSDD